MEKAAFKEVTLCFKRESMTYVYSDVLPVSSMNILRMVERRPLKILLKL